MSSSYLTECTRGLAQCRAYINRALHEIEDWPIPHELHHNGKVYPSNKTQAVVVATEDDCMQWHVPVEDVTKTATVREETFSSHFYGPVRRLEHNETSAGGVHVELDVDITILVPRLTVRSAVQNPFSPCGKQCVYQTCNCQGIGVYGPPDDWPEDRDLWGVHCVGDDNLTIAMVAKLAVDFDFFVVDGAAVARPRAAGGWVTRETLNSSFVNVSVVSMDYTCNLTSVVQVRQSVSIAPSWVALNACVCTCMADLLTQRSLGRPSAGGAGRRRVCRLRVLADLV